MEKEIHQRAFLHLRCHSRHFHQCAPMASNHSDPRCDSVGLGGCSSDAGAPSHASVCRSASSATEATVEAVEQVGGGSGRKDTKSMDKLSL